MYDVLKVIAAAEAEVGYLEKASNKDLDSKTANAGKANFTKYARDLDNIPGFYNGKKNGFPWCDVFVDWCFVQAYGVEEAKSLLCQPAKSLGAGCTYSARYYKEKGQLHNSPKAGDQIFFGTSNGTCTHTGIVYKVDSNKVYTIEGNTSGASGVISNGGGVCRKSYNLSSSSIYGYGRPKYNENASSEPEKETSESVKIDVTYRVQANGRWLPEVKNLEDYAGNIGQAVTALAVKVSKGSVKYRVHLAKERRWLNWITGYNMNDFYQGYAGNGKGHPIDAVQVYFYTPDDIRPYQQAYYRVSELKENYMPWQEDTSAKNNMDGYAGNANGKAIDRIQIQIKQR